LCIQAIIAKIVPIFIRAIIVTEIPPISPVIATVIMIGWKLLIILSIVFTDLEIIPETSNRDNTFIGNIVQIIGSICSRIVKIPEKSSSVSPGSLR